MKQPMEQLNKTIADVLGIDIQNVNINLDKSSCSEWDSFNHIVLMDEIEKVFDIHITIEESEKIDSYAEIVRLVEKGAAK